MNFPLEQQQQKRTTSIDQEFPSTNEPKPANVMKLQPKFSVSRNEEPPPSTTPKKQTQPKSEDYFASMEPQYKPPKTLVVRNNDNSSSRQPSTHKKNALGFEVSEDDMEFHMTTEGWEVDDAILPAKQNEKPFSVKKPKETFEW